MKYYTILFLALGALLSCRDNRQAAVLQPGAAIQIDSVPGACPYLTKDTKGNMVVSWARMPDDSTSVFCYAVATGNGRSFGKPVVIPGSDNLQPHAENLPKIIFKPSGEIIALWGTANSNAANKYAGLVFYSQSFDQGLTWNAPRALVNDTAGHDQRYYDVALLPDGEAAVIWLDNRTAAPQDDGSALYFAATAGKDGFGEEKMIARHCCECCRTDLFIDSKAGIHVLYRAILKDSIRDMVHSVSNDGGRNFSPPQPIGKDNWVINGCPHTGPAMTENKEGLHFAWFTGGRNKGCFYTQSADNGSRFAPQQKISSLGSHPQLTTFAGGRLAIVWDEAVQGESVFSKRIGMQFRSSTGMKEQQGFITGNTETAAYPVILPADAHTVFVAYTMKKDAKEYVMCQYIHPE